MIDKIANEIIGAAKELHLAPNDFSECSLEHARRVVLAAKQTFVSGNLRSWWMSLKYPFESFDNSDACGLERITEHLPHGVTHCWFIPEVEEDDLPVFDVAVQRIGELLGQCSFFEYYLVGKEYDWILIENDHNQIIVSRTPDCVMIT